MTHAVVIQTKIDPSSDLAITQWEQIAVPLTRATNAGLGEPVAAMTETARGWGRHNVVYRLDTTDGRWAVKALLREVDGLIREYFDIELAAFTGGVSMPRPVPA